MKASVVIPVYNAQDFIAETIESALNQTLNDHEVIVINDGSTDGSEKEILRYEGRIVYISRENRGVSASRNEGALIAKGEYIAFLDQDDLFMPDKLDKMSRFLDQNPDYIMVYSKGGRIDAAGNPLPFKKMPDYSGDIFPKLYMHCYIAPSMVMCRRQSFLDAGMFQGRFSSEGEDYDLFLRISSLAPVGIVREDLVKYRVHMDNTSKSKEQLAPFRMEEVLEQFTPYLLKHYRFGWWLHRSRMAKIYREQARVYLQLGKTQDAARAYRRSIKSYPLRLDVYKDMLFGYKR
ncbi:MAG: glycosyltransferase [Deltaproteobacteria bacterium]|nr:glycosyltransferase [Deltaproteobacteria bacterium]